MGEFAKDDLLRSWKEIAAYLGVDVRTCYRWEDERDMPVHRAEAAERKSPVFAYKSELDVWFAETFKSSHPHEVRAAGRRLPWILGGAALLVAAGALAYFLARPPRQPADFRIEGSVFVALDKDKRELWRRDTGAEDLQTESFYRDNFQVMHTERQNILPMLVIRDIDGDGDTEVLFALARQGDRSQEGTLFCWDRRGRERWRFQAGRALKSRSKLFGPDYRIAGIYVHDLDRDGRREILVESFYASDWPCQLALLDAAGKTIGEFWNAGYLREPAYHDIDGDGREELIVVGVNNEYRGGCLAVFDTRAIAGGSPQTGDFVLEGVVPGSMLYYVTTPYTEVSLAKRIAVDGLRRVSIMGNDWIEVEAGIGVTYDFDFRLACIQATLGHGFQMDYYELSRSGAIAGMPFEAYVKLLLEGIRWWDGKAWSAKPTPVKR